MSLPKVTISYANGNLLQDIANLDGIAAICGTGSTGGLLGVPKVVYNLAEAEGLGFTSAAEPDMHRHLKEFYAEVAGNQELHIMIVADTTTMEDMLDNTNESGAKKLINNANGKVRLLGVFRNPDGAYDGGTDFIDDDVAAAITISKTFAEARLTELIPLRVLIEGRVENPAAANVLSPDESANGFAGVVLGGSLNDGSSSVGTALGRAVKYGAHIKLGKVANGPLSLTSCYVGDDELKDVTNLATLHGDGFISFMQHPNKAGFYFGIDRMASLDDYRLMAHGRVVDKAAIIAAAVYIDELEGEVEVDADGNLTTEAINYLERKIEQNVLVNMPDQISGFEAYIDPDQDIISTSKITVVARVRPLGYTSFIDVELGITAN